MPITSRAFIRRNLLVLAVGFLALVGIIVASLVLAYRSEATTSAVLTARAMRSALIDLKSTLQDSETGQRGYLLTTDPEYLAPYEKARDQMPAAIKRVVDASADFPDIAARLPGLQDIIKAKLAELQKTVDLNKAGAHEDALKVVRTNQGKDLMDQARAVFAVTTDAVETQLLARLDDQRTSAIALRWVLIIGAIIILGSVTAGGLTVVRYTRDLAEARGEIEMLNVGLEDKVKERTVALGRANEEIQRFAYIVTHDLRAPLVNIMGFTSELEASLAPIRELVEGSQSGTVNPALLPAAKTSAEEDLPEAIGFIRSSTKKMDGLINAILKLSREGRRPLRPETIDLEALLRASEATVQHQVEEAGGELALKLQIKTVVSDRLTLEQVIGNLLDNAIKYRSPGRPLRLTVRTQREFANRTLIEVEDNGRGIAAQDHERIFELFRRSGVQDQTGEGIGLAHVRSAIRMIGGDISVDSELNKGSIFKISLPQDLGIFIRNQSNER